MPRSMLSYIDNFLNRITMYRLVLYELLALIGIGALLGFFHQLPYDPIAILAETAFITAVATLANKLFARVFAAPTNVESAAITALILSLIISPPHAGAYLAALPLLIWAPVLAMASKFILAWRKKHVFNPAAIAVAITAVALGQSATWWVGTFVMAPFVALGGILITRKIRRTDLVASFLAVASAMMVSVTMAKGTPLVSALERTFFDTPMLFFAFVMLTEPLTTPPQRLGRIIYGGLTGLLFTPAVHIGSLYSTPELALNAGNIFSYLISPKERIVATLKKRIAVAANTFDFIFSANHRLAFAPGQYLEWTLPHEHADSRGNRRYFTIASSPTEPDLRIGVKIYPEPSSFKRALLALAPGDTIAASELAGNFVLPKNKEEKLVFIAGGIGITPFRSMIRYMLDRNERRPVTIIYANNTIPDIAYTDILDEAYEKLGLKTVYTLTDMTASPPEWGGRRGFIDTSMIREEVPDYHEHMFYVSGPHAMVKATERLLKSVGIASRNIRTDFFPGFA